jgi:hypothetical protein
MSNLVPVGVTADGSLVAAVGIDYGIWDKDAAAIAQRQMFKAPKKTILVAGRLSPQAQQAIRKAGWTVNSELRG